MDSILRAIGIYLFLVVLLRLIGKRTLGEMATFDVILLVLIGVSMQEALIGSDHSVTNGVLIAMTLLCMDLFFMLLKKQIPRFGALIDGTPTPLIINGRLRRDSMEQNFIDTTDILS